MTTWAALALATSAATTAFSATGDITLLGQISPVGSDQFTNPWGFERDGRVYAVVGDWNSGPVIIDVTDPTNPFVRKTITGAGVFGFDVKVWGDYIYTCEGRFGTPGGSSRAIDITNLDLPVISDPFVNVHGLAVHPAGYLFTAYQGVRCYDLNADPTPTSTGYLWYDGTLSGHDTTVDVEHNRLYDFHGYDDTYIFDISNINSRVLLGSIVDPTIIYNHSGDATEDGNHLFVCDELQEGGGTDCTVWEISNPATPSKVGFISDGSATIHNLYIVGDFAFVSYYTAGFRVYDVSNPASPVLLDTYDTDPLHSGDGWDSGCYGIYPYGPSGVVYATDQENGLFLFAVEGYAGPSTAVGDVTPRPASARVLGNYPNPFNPATTIAYEIEHGAEVTLSIHDAAGRLVRVLSRGHEGAGRHESRWDGVDDRGNRAASGVYFVRLTAGGATDTGRLVLLK
jgi:choice-of-anchor B domain-containing protein